MAKMTVNLSVKLFAIKKGVDAGLEPLASVTCDVADGLFITPSQIEDAKKKLGLAMCRLFGADFYSATTRVSGSAQAKEEA